MGRMKSLGYAYAEYLQDENDPQIDVDQYFEDIIHGEVEIPKWFVEQWLVANPIFASEEFSAEESYEVIMVNVNHSMERDGETFVFGDVMFGLPNNGRSRISSYGQGPDKPSARQSLIDRAVDYLVEEEFNAESFDAETNFDILNIEYMEDGEETFDYPESMLVPVETRKDDHWTHTKDRIRVKIKSYIRRNFGNDVEVIDFLAFPIGSEYALGQEMNAENFEAPTSFVWCVVRSFNEDDGNGLLPVENTSVLGVFKYKKDADKALKSVYNEMKSQGLEVSMDYAGDFYTDNGHIKTTKSKLGQLWMPYGAYRFWNAEEGSAPITKIEIYQEWHNAKEQDRDEYRRHSPKRIQRRVGGKFAQGLNAPTPNQIKVFQKYGVGRVESVLDELAPEDKARWFRYAKGNFGAETFEASNAADFYRNCNQKGWSVLGRTMHYGCSVFGKVVGGGAVVANTLNFYDKGGRVLRTAGTNNNFHPALELAKVSRELQPDSIGDWSRVAQVTNERLSQNFSAETKSWRIQNRDSSGKFTKGFVEEIDIADFMELEPEAIPEISVEMTYTPEQTVDFVNSMINDDDLPTRLIDSSFVNTLQSHVSSADLEMLQALNDAANMAAFEALMNGSAENQQAASRAVFVTDMLMNYKWGQDYWASEWE